MIVSFLLIKNDTNQLLNIDNISPELKNNEITDQIGQENKEVIVSKAKINTPGPLKVITNLFTSKDEILTKNNIIDLTNKYRESNGNLNFLKENTKLYLSAQKKLEDMFLGQYFEHISPLKISIEDLEEQVGYEYILIGENLAMGNFKNDLSLVDAWMDSPGHRKNILNKNYTEIGVAVGQGNFKGKKIWLAVQHFGTPRSVCPSISEVLYGIININKEKIKETEANLIIKKYKINKKEVYQGKTYYEQIDTYNDLVSYYNDLLSKTKEQIETYNKQIQSFNLCLSSYK